VRVKLAANRLTTPLFDTDRFRRHIEAAYTAMWERHRQGLPPAGFAVEPTA
jgi:protein O-GlcNAc transferase